MHYIHTMLACFASVVAALGVSGAQATSTLPLDVFVEIPAIETLGSVGEKFQVWGYADAERKTVSLTWSYHATPGADIVPAVTHEYTTSFFPTAVGAAHRSHQETILVAGKTKSGACVVEVWKLAAPAFKFGAETQLDDAVVPIERNEIHRELSSSWVIGCWPALHSSSGNEYFVMMLNPTTKERVIALGDATSGDWVPQLSSQGHPVLSRTCDRLSLYRHSVKGFVYMFSNPELARVWAISDVALDGSALTVDVIDLQCFTGLYGDETLYLEHYPSLR